jgi:ribosomal protein L29
LAEPVTFSICELPKVRKRIARINTIIRERELGKK